MADLKIVGKPRPCIGAFEKATGCLEYITDLKLPGMLHGKILRSPHSHARIVHIDTRRARRLSGVKAVITSEQTPRILYGPIIADQYPLAVDRVRYMGDAIAAVAAIDLDTATEALQLIRVEYEELPAVFDIEEAMIPGAPLLHGTERNLATSAEWEHGDVTEAFCQSDLVLEQRFSTQLVHQCYLEPMAALADWDGRGRVTFWLPIQVPSVAQRTYAKALGLSPDKVRVIQCHMGGAFGAKLEHSFHLVCALLAKAAGRPVRIVYTREEEFQAGLPRVPMVIHLKVGAKRDGTLTGKKAHLIAGNGAYTSYGPAILSAAATRSDCLYRLRNVHTRMDLVYTNSIPTGCFRGFGNVQMHFANESMMDMLADGLGLDPIEIRLRNATQPGDVTVHGFRIGSCGLSDCLRQAAQRSRWQEKRVHRERHRGVGVAAMIHVSGNRSFMPQFDGSAAIIQVGGDGKATVLTGEVDMGQGSYTVFAQIAAEELGFHIDDITVPNVDTEISPFGLGSWASRVTTLGGNAVKAAAEDARHQLFAMASEMLGVTPEELIAEDGRIHAPDGRGISITDAAQEYMYQHGGLPVLGRGYFVPPGVEVSHPETKHGNISCAYPFGVQVAEVEVDVDTGCVRVLKVVAAHDVGKLINPLGAEGQLEGGIAQGVGFALTEHIKMDCGKVTNPSFLDYKIPTTLDVPEVECIFVESQDPYGPYGAKGIAEPAIIPTAPAIANAVFNAIGVWITELPITPERILTALQEARARRPVS